ncbi:MFS transporter [Ruania zhangjianzhongii]|uniref:MFS transporter n=1 Tax=Ruania zhangjianzhongii TaxID=2603206 RepID=UPI0011CB1B07|nr:MFS transporter [Ruania zhangjianzhongii]
MASPPTLRRLLLVLVPAMMVVPVSSDMVSLVLPGITAEFRASTADVAWVVTGFLLACGIGIPLYGRMADGFSLRRLFVIALAVYAAGSLISAVAPVLPVLVAGRIVAGAGGAAIPVLTIVAATRLLPRRQTALGVGFIAAAGGLGAALGPAVGGGLGQWLGWRSLFWLMTTLGITLIPAVARILPDSRPTVARRLDLVGGTLLGAGVGLLLFGVTRAGGEHGFSAPASWGCLLLGVVALILVPVRGRTMTDPFIPPALFRYRGYLAAVGVIFLAMLVNLTALVLVPLLVIDVNGLTPGEGSLIMVPGGITLALTSTLAGRLAANGAGPTRLTVFGLGLLTVAMLVMSAVAGRTPVLAALAVAILGAGFAFVVTLSTHAISQVLPAPLVGSGIGIFQSAQFLGAGVGPAVFGVLLSWRQTGSNETVNPMATTAAPAYSDVFLLLALLSLIAVVPALRLRTRAAPDTSDARAT